MVGPRPSTSTLCAPACRGRHHSGSPPHDEQADRAVDFVNQVTARASSSHFLSGRTVCVPAAITTGIGRTRRLVEGYLCVSWRLGRWVKGLQVFLIMRTREPVAIAHTCTEQAHWSCWEIPASPRLHGL